MPAASDGGQSSVTASVNPVEPGLPRPSPAVPPGSSPSEKRLEDLTADVAALARAASGAPHVDLLLRNSLDWITRIAPYDLACVFELHGHVLKVRQARGALVNSRVLNHAIDLERFPAIREALASGEGRAFTSDDHAFGDGDPFDGVLDLPPGHSCMVVPLCAPGCRVGLLTLDRKQCETYPEQTVRLIEVCCQLISLALENAHQRELLDRYQVQQASYLESLRLEAIPADVLSTYVNSRMPEVRQLIERLEHIAPLSAPVLIQGETGVGKEVYARLMHEASPRRRQPFIKVNCAALPENLFESELFGHVKGAFTGATTDRPGRFRTANGGTLFLDEIGEAPPAMQAKLLRVLQEGEFEPVGSDRTVKVDVRILAATNVHLDTAIQEKRFRADLYYRLSVFPILLPSLRDRLEDLSLLSRTLLAAARARNGRGPLELSEDGLELLRRYPWPGNIRELGNVLERASFLRGPTPVLTAAHIAPALGGIGSGPWEAGPLAGPAAARAGAGALRGVEVGEGSAASTKAGAGTAMTGGVPGAERAGSAMTGGVQVAERAGSAMTGGVPVAERAGTLEDVQRAEIIRVLRETRGKLYGEDGAAVRLGLKPSTLQARMKKLGIDRLAAAGRG